MWLTSSDVIVVTGGGNGLGAQMVRRFVLDGFSVAALDVSLPEPNDRYDQALYIKCDISDIASLENAREEIHCTFGTPTVLINNAAIRRAMDSVIDTDVATFEQTIDINLVGAFKALKVFLPGMLLRQRGFVVNVASALGFVSPAGLSSYGASKAGVLGLHESLVHENAAHPYIKFLLVCPGQINTKMFEDVQTPSKLLAPIISQFALSGKIVKLVETGKDGRLYTPLYVSFLPLLRLMPLPLANVLRQMSGVDQASGA